MKTNRFFYTLFFVLLFSCVSGTGQNPVISLISPGELADMLPDQDIQIIDVRTPDEVASGMITKAIHIDFYDEQFDQKIGRLNKDKPVVLYCASGIRSARASSKLVESGFVRIYDLKGGVGAWLEDGRELISP